jgi:hypothetical protein
MVRNRGLFHFGYKKTVFAGSLWEKMTCLFFILSEAWSAAAFCRKASALNSRMVLHGREKMILAALSDTGHNKSACFRPANVKAIQRITLLNSMNHLHHQKPANYKATRDRAVRAPVPAIHG